MITLEKIRRLKVPRTDMDKRVLSSLISHLMIRVARQALRSQVTYMENFWELALTAHLGTPVTLTSIHAPMPNTRTKQMNRKNIAFRFSEIDSVGVS